MKRLRPIDGLAFTIGALIGTGMAIMQTPWSWPVMMVLTFLCPGSVVGLPLLGLILPMGWKTPGFWQIVIAGVGLTNGLLFLLVSYLARVAVKGDRVALLTLLVGLGLWTPWFVQWSVANRPTPELPLSPVNYSSPLAGRWDGVEHGARSDVPVTLICLPRTDGKLDGFMYANGEPLGSLEAGSFAGDSLRFDLHGFQQRGRSDSTRMTIESTASGTSQLIELRHVSSSTAMLTLPGKQP